MAVRTTTAEQAARPPLALPPNLRPLRIALYLLTVLSAAAALFLEPALAGAVSRGAISPHWLFTAIGIYGVLFLAYSVDRWVLVRQRRYPAGKAFFQFAFGLIFGLLLLPSTIGDYAARAPRGMERLVSHPDPEVRMLAVEALGFRGLGKENVAILLTKLKDRDPRVQEAARTVLSKWSGRAPEDTIGIQAWASELSRTSTMTRGEGLR